MFQFIEILTFSLIYIVIIEINSLDKKEFLFNEPDFEIEEIPEEWRQLCGYRYQPHRYLIQYQPKCFGAYMTKNLSEEYKPERRSTVTSRIIHGNDSELRESPWTVQLASRRYEGILWKTFEGYRAWCTGVLITMRHILTAAHCYDPNVPLVIFAGNLEAFDTRYYIGDKYIFYLHPNYVKEVLPNGTVVNDKWFDIGVIILKDPIDPTMIRGFSSDRNEMVINTICLPKEEYSMEYDFKPITYFGWGKVSGDRSANMLQKGDFLAIHGVHKMCQWSYCLETEWSPRTTAGCPGDSGSGVIQYLDQSRGRAVLIGIVSRVEIFNKTTKSCFEGQNRKVWSIRVVRHINWIREVIRNTTHMIID